jgi:PAS domain S-box-containing protein
MHRSPRGKRAVLLGFFLAVLPYTAPAVYLVATPGSLPELTPHEQAWIAAHPVIRVGNDPGWMPIDFDDERGQPVGVAADLLKLVGERLGLRFEAVPGQSWQEAYAAAQRREVDLLLALGRDPDREQQFAYTEPYITFRSVVVVRDDVPFVPDISALLGKRFALVRDYNETDLLRRQYPQMNVLLVESPDDALKLVSAGQADATVGSIAVLHFKIRLLGLSNLKVAAPTDEADRMVYMGVRKDWPELAALLNKGLASITAEERAAIVDRWFSVEFERGLDPGRVVSWSLAATAGLAAAGVLGFWWLRRLRLEVEYRRESEARTVAAERRLRLVTDTIPGLIVHTAIRPGPGARREWRFMSGQMPARYGLDIEFMRQHDLFEFIEPDDRPMVQATMTASMKSLAPWQMSYRIRLPNGELRWHHNEASLLREADGTTLVTSYVSDITERKQLEQQLAEAKEHAEAAERRLRDFTDSVPGMVLQVVVAGDSSLRVDFITGRMLAGYGLDREQYVRDFMKLWDLIIPEDREKSEKAIWAAISSLAPLQIAYRIRIPSGEVRWNLNETFSRREPRGIVVTSYISDITERKRLEDQLSAAEQQLRVVTDTIPGFILHIHLAHGFEPTVRFASGQLSARYGVDNQHWMDFRHQIEFIVPEDREAVLNKMLASVKSRESWQVTYRVRLPDGQIRWNLHEATVRAEPDGSTSVISYINDITERIQLEQQLAVAKEQAESASRTKGEFLANMSHEIRTPLNAIIGLSYLATRGEAPPRTRDYLDKITSSAQALLGIVNDILDVSKIEVGKLTLEHTPFDLDDVLTHLSNVVGHKAAEKGLELLFSIPREVPRHRVGDPLRLGQVLLNLVSNAIKFTEHGQIVVSVRPQPGDDGKAWLEFSVSDSGIGMTPEQLGRLFEAFTQADTSITRKYGGTGLGLSISRSLVERMGGRIEAQSEAGRGSTFRFRIPLEVGAAPVAAAGPSLAPLIGLRVLVADDNAASREILGAYLQSFEIEALAVATGRAALDALAQGAREGRPFRLVLLDWRLPDMGGDELVRAIRALDLRPPAALMLVSALGREDLVEHGERLDLDGVLTKPFNPSLLLESIIRALGGGAAVRAFPPAEEAPALQPGRLAGMEVLVVEDNLMNQLVVRELLEAAGAAVTIAGNGRQALEQVELRTFNLILMDLQMPVLDGIEAARRLRASGCRVPIVAMTASALPGDARRCLDVGMNDYLSKPLNLARMSSVLERVLELGGPAPPPAPRTGAAPGMAEALGPLLATLRTQLGMNDSSAVDTMDRIQHVLDGRPRPRSVRELAQLVDAFSFEAALLKLEQASADLGLETYSNE